MIITSLLDTDLYKFTMMQVVLHQFPGAQVEYKFKCRNPGVQLAPFASEIRDEIRSLCCLQFQDAELAYLRSLRFIKSDFVDFLGLFKLNEKYITVTPQHNGEIEITIRGPWLHTILFEIPVLAIINEVQRGLAERLDMQAMYDVVGDKIREIFDAQVVDIGIVDYRTERIHFPYSIERGVRFPDEPMPIEGPRRFVLETRRPLHLAASAYERAIEMGGSPVVAQGEPAKSIIFAPLVAGEQARGVIAEIGPGSHVVMVGAGFIAFTILNSILALGARLTIVEIAPQILPRMIDRQGASLVDAWLRKHGVEIRTGATLSAVEQHAGRRPVVDGDGGERPLVVHHQRRQRALHGHEA